MMLLGSGVVPFELPSIVNVLPTESCLPLSKCGKDNLERVASDARVLVPVNRVTAGYDRILQVQPVRAIAQAWTVKAASLGADVEPILVDKTARSTEVYRLIKVADTTVVWLGG